MSATASLTRSINLGGKTFTETKSMSGDGAIVVDKSVSAAKTGVIANRTDNDTADITAAAGHGITTGQIVDVYWTESGVAKARYNMTVGTVVSNTVPIDGGSGDNLPANATAVTVMVEQVEAMLFAGNNMSMLVIQAGAKAVVTFKDAGGIELTKVFDEAGVFVWHSGLDDTNPLAGDDIITVTFTHGDSSGAKDIKVGVLYT